MNMMYKKILIPNKESHSFRIPEGFYGKTVAVIVVELDDKPTPEDPLPPFAEKRAVSELFESFGKAPDSSPSIE